VAPRSDVRGRMVAAGEDLLSHRGYGITLLDVIAKADAPRGSIYYHFPNGKTELAVEVAAKVKGEIEQLVAWADGRTADPVAFLQRLVGHHRKRLVGSGFTLGCPLMGIVVTGDVESGPLPEAVDAAFAAWLGSIAAALEGKGLPAASAERLASTFVAGIEGAIVVARARRSGKPFDDLAATVPALVAAAAPAPAT
jgi:TetR/AcrR family transcriptional regulator, lmrAB and yxaGH operons repressor